MWLHSAILARRRKAGAKLRPKGAGGSASAKIVPTAKPTMANTISIVPPDQFSTLGICTAVLLVARSRN